MPRLLRSLRSSGDGLAMRLILVDNASIDGAEQWEGRFPQMTLLHNAGRLGYAANLNRIVLSAAARYVLLMNTDMLFDPQERCLRKMVEFMDAHPRCGLAGCRIYHRDGSYAYPARRFQTVRIILARRCGLGGLMPGVLPQYLYQERSIDAAWPCDWLSGCFLVARRTALEEVGLFDTRFVKYFEDCDMGLRMARAGWQTMFNGATYCYHLERRGSKNLLSADAWRHARSYLCWLRKWGFSPEAPVVPDAVRRAA
jgi:GT2 family glycosyltransferase